MDGPSLTSPLLSEGCLRLYTFPLTALLTLRLGVDSVGQNTASSYFSQYLCPDSSPKKGEKYLKNESRNKVVSNPEGGRGRQAMRL